MIRTPTLATLLVSTVVSAFGGCGGARPHADTDDGGFKCRDRAAGYTATGHISGSDVGVQIDCAEAGPRIKRWRTSKAGARQEDSRAMTPDEFDKLWREIDGTGWPNLHDCANGSLDKGDPVYQFALKDDTNSSAFKCQTRVMPYPYNDITDPLDLAAGQGRKQLGDDEPADANQLDHKDKQR